MSNGDDHQQQKEQHQEHQEDHHQQLDCSWELDSDEQDEEEQEGNDCQHDPDHGSHDHPDSASSPQRLSSIPLLLAGYKHAHKDGLNHSLLTRQQHG